MAKMKDIEAMLNLQDDLDGIPSVDENGEI